MDDKYVNILAQKLLNRTITAQELEELEEWYNTYDSFEVEVKSDFDEETLGERLFKQICSDAENLKDPKPNYSIWARLAVASVVLLMISSGLWYFVYQNTSQRELSYIDIPGGKNYATLTLASGKRIELSDISTGQLAEESGVSITKTADGQILYTVENPKKLSDELLYNVIETPRGGQYQVVLPDGSHVQLNAASSLKFPSSFIHLAERKVVLDGEGYFKVKHDVNHPFKVQTRGQIVEDLGTSFNISSYSDELTTTTTLVEGLAKVSLMLPGKANLTNNVLLKPGRQAVFINEELIEQEGNITNALAWKNGYFILNDSDFKSIMNKISRWYNVEVVYEAEPKGLQLVGKISRSQNLSAIIRALEATGKVHFRIEGRRITVID